MKQIIASICFWYIQKFADSNRKWTDETFGKLTGIAALEHLKKEVGETIDACKHSDETIYCHPVFGDKENWGENKKSELIEFADCYLLLLNALHKRRYTFRQLHIAAEAKMEVNKSRKWGKVNEQGFVEHLKD